jgi:outer membrane autotransporter protein
MRVADSAGKTEEIEGLSARSGFVSLGQTRFSISTLGWRPRIYGWRHFWPVIFFATAFGAPLPLSATSPLQYFISPAGYTSFYGPPIAGPGPTILEINTPNSYGGNIRTYDDPGAGFTAQGAFNDYGGTKLALYNINFSQGIIQLESVITVYAPPPATDDTVVFGYLGPNSPGVPAGLAPPVPPGQQQYSVALGSQTVEETVAGFFTGGTLGPIPSDSAITFTLSGTYTSTAHAELEGQRINLDGSGTFTTPFLYVAGNVTVKGGTLHGGATFIDNALNTAGASPGVIIEGAAPASTTLTITGANAKFEAPSYLEVGISANGPATLDIADGGQATTGSVYLGLNANSTGNLTVDGGSLMATAPVIIGYSGAGNMTVQNNGTVSVMGSGSYVDVGGFAGSSGTLAVTSGASMTVAGELSVGAAGSPGDTLSISSGGTVTSGSSGAAGAFGGVIAGGTTGSASGGTATINGNGSSWDIKDSLSIGAGGTGLLTASDGGALQVDGSTIELGHNAGGIGTLSLTGAGTSLMSNSQMIVGDAGTGAFDVAAGAQSSGATAVLTAGNQAGSSGTVHITGDGSSVSFASATIGAAGTATANIDDGGMMTVTNDMVIGADNAGTVNITTGGGLTVNGDLSLGQNVGSTGILNLTGDGASVEVDGDLMAGVSGDAQINITEGASLSDGGILAVNPGSTAIVTLTDQNSSWDVSDDLIIGVAGAATVNIANETTVSVSGDNVILGEQPSGSGDLQISGGRATLDFSGSLIIGGAGQGQVNLLMGAPLKLQSITVGEMTGGGGIFNIDGGGTAVLASLQVTAGLSGQGTINVTEGGQLEAYTSAIGALVGSIGVVSVSDNNSSYQANIITVGGTDTTSGGTGHLTVSNAGQVLVNNTLTLWQHGTVDVTGGGVVEVGSDAAPLVGPQSGDYVQINQAGLVQGVGTIDGNVINNGGVRAGDDPGTLTINGNFNQGAAGTLDIEVEGTVPGSPTGYSVLDVTGNAMLAGTLELSYLNGYKPTVGETLDFLTVGGATTGNFNAVTLDGVPTLDINDTLVNGVLTVTAVTRNYLNPALAVQLSPNQQAVGGSLNSVANTATGDLNTLLTSIDNLGNAQQIGQAFDQLSPQRLGIFRSIAFDNYSFFSQQLDDHFANLREGMTGLDTNNFSFNDAALGSSLSQIKGHLLAWQPAPEPGLLSDTTNPVLGGVTMSDAPVTEQDRFSAFINGNVTLADLDSNADVSHSSYTTGGVTLGADYRLDRHWVVGALFGYNHTDADLDNEGSTATVDTYSPGIYATYADRGWYANGIFNYGYNSYTESRNIIFPGTDRTAIGAPQGNQYSNDLDGGYEFHLGSLTVGPSAGLNYVHLDINSFNEGDAGAASLSVQEQNADSLRSRLGFDARWKTKYLTTDFTYHLSASWQHEFMDNSQSIISSLETPGDTAFTVQGTGPDRDSALIDAGVDVLAAKNVDLYVDYQTEAGETSFFAQSVQAGVKIGF